MEKAVIDTSVMVKWFVEEPDSYLANKVLRRIADNDLKVFVPETAGLELLNAVSFGSHEPKPTVKNVLEKFFFLGFETIPVDKYLLRQTLSIMEELKITAYDSLFLATARMKKAILITADKKHHKKEYYKGITYLEDLT